MISATGRTKTLIRTRVDIPASTNHRRLLQQVWKTAVENRDSNPDLCGDRSALPTELIPRCVKLAAGLWATLGGEVSIAAMQSVPAGATITPERLASFDEVSIAELARRLDEDDYSTPFDGLSDWHLLRALAIHRPDLTAPYVHLVDQEPFDED